MFALILLCILDLLTKGRGHYHFRVEQNTESMPCECHVQWYGQGLVLPLPCPLLFHQPHFPEDVPPNLPVCSHICCALCKKLSPRD